MDVPSADAAIAAVLDLVERPGARLHGNGRIDPVNDAMHAWLEELGLAVHGCTISELPLPEEDREALLGFVSGTDDVIRFSTLIGTEPSRPVTVLGTSVADGSRIVIFWEDERLQRAEAEVRRLHRLQTLGRALQGFVHDLNNSLGVVMGLSDLLARNPASAKKQNVLQSLSRAAGDAADLLRFVADHVAETRVGRERIDLETVADKLISATLSRARSAHVEVVANLFERPATVWAPKPEMTQLLVQLIVHAIETAGAGGRVEIAEFVADRNLAAIDIRVDGEREADDQLAALFAAPERGVSVQRIDTFRGDARSLLESWSVLLLGGGRVDYRCQSGERVFRVFVPKAIVRTTP